MHRRWLMMALLALGCGEEELALDRRDFRLQSAQGYDVLTGTSIYVRFAEGNLSAGAGCNNLGGEYRVQDGALVVSELSLTERGCETPQHHAQDQWLADFLLAKPTLALDDNQLVMRAKGAALTFLDREVADPDRALVGALWLIDSFLHDDAISNLPLARDPTVEFRADGTYVVDTTCNQLSGRYQVQGDQLVLSNASSTDALCFGAAGSADASLQQLFGRTMLRFTIEARRLTLGDNTSGISARVD
jgi:heat shock protein HslJ